MKKFSIVEKGYNQKEVNEFLDIVINRLEKVVAENNKLNLQIEELKKELKENGNAEERLNKAILAVQETSDRMKELARAESQMIIEDAKKILKDAGSSIADSLGNDRENIKLETRDMIASYKELAEEISKQKEKMAESETISDEDQEKLEEMELEIHK